MISHPAVILAFLISVTSSLVIKSHWQHVKLKLVPPARVDVRKSSQLHLTCSATGSPAPKVAWYKDDLFVPHLNFDLEEDSSIGETVTVLKVPCVTKETVGKYECRARSGIKETSVVTEVNVVDYDENVCNDDGEPEILMWRPMMMVEEGGSIVLPCSVKHPHEHKITWANMKGDEIVNDVRFYVKDNGDLAISDVTWADMGQYSCTATNLHGTSSVKTFLYPLAQGVKR